MWKQGHSTSEVIQVGERLILRCGSKGTPHRRVRSPPSERTPFIPPLPSPAVAAWPPVRASLEFSAPPAMTLLLLSTFPNTNDLLAALADAARCSEAVAVRPMKEAP